jgi:hypothetical protein
MVFSKNLSKEEISRIRKERYLKNKEKIAQQRKIIYYNNREEILKKNREYSRTPEGKLLTHKYNQNHYLKVKDSSLYKEKNKEYYIKNKSKIRLKQNTWERKVYIDYKKLVYDHYGNKCNWPGCNETESYHLSIDHVNNDGKHNKQSGTRGLKLYRQIVKDNFPDTFQILCHNHNYEKKLKYEESLRVNKKTTV